MTPRVLSLACVALAGTACGLGTPGTSADPFAALSGTTIEDMPQPDRGPGRVGGAGFVLEPGSVEIEDETAYRFSLGHCGLLSPIDVDGSFWDARDGTTAAGAQIDLATDGEMVHATSGVIVVIGDEMRFRTTSGSVVRFERHAGEKEFRACQ